MISPCSSNDELQRLASALCDGEISPKEAQRLESLATQSPAALDEFVKYLALHAELAWMHRPAAKPGGSRSEEPVASPPRRKISPRWTRVMVEVAVVLLVGVFFTLAILYRREPAVVATLIRSEGVKWSGKAIREGAELVAGQLVRLESGLAEIRFHSGARVIVDGRSEEARFRTSSTSEGELQQGRLAARVPPRARGFTIGTPEATITDLGTEIGVAVTEQGTSEVHVFAGNVRVHRARPSKASVLDENIAAGEAVRVALAGNRAPPLESVPLGKRAFVRAIPPRGPVERLRQLVASDPHLLHHYPFEGIGREYACADEWNDLDLAAVPMVGGAGGMDIYESAPGLDSHTTALHPYRGKETVGVALQSRAAFEPARGFTVELLLLLESTTTPTGAIVASAFAFQMAPPGAGSLGVAADRGHLVFRLGPSIPQRADAAVLEPGRWYYAVATFEAGEGQTTVHAYLADLEYGDCQLVQVAGDLVVEGTPASGPLGIGKGFDRNGADAYPWAGRLDEIAIYDAVLDRQTLEQHLGALVGKL